MKGQPQTIMHSRILVLAVVLIFGVLAIADSQIAAEVGAQGSKALSKLVLKAEEDGFSGTYTLEGKIYAIENHVKNEAFRTRISRPDGSFLIESSQEGDIILVSLPTGQLKIDSVKPTPFSAEEIKTIKEFVQSDDAVVVRKIVQEVFNQRATEKHPLLGGFRVIAMLLGE